MEPPCEKTYEDRKALGDPSDHNSPGGTFLDGVERTISIQTETFVTDSPVPRTHICGPGFGRGVELRNGTDLLASMLRPEGIQNT